MGNKYIIKNCPCRMELHENDCFGHTGYNNCCACTDCLLKQIVHILEREPIMIDMKDEFEQMYKLARVIFAKEILAKLDIERVE